MSKTLVRILGILSNLSVGIIPRSRDSGSKDVCIFNLGRYAKLPPRGLGASHSSAKHLPIVVLTALCWQPFYLCLSKGTNGIYCCLHFGWVKTEHCFLCLLAIRFSSVIFLLLTMMETVLSCLDPSSGCSSFPQLLCWGQHKESVVQSPSWIVSAEVSPLAEVFPTSLEYPTSKD